MRGAFALVDSFPRIARVPDEVDRVTRGFPTGVHIIFYQIDDADNVLILRIRHAREDWQEG